MTIQNVINSLLEAARQSEEGLDTEVYYKEPTTHKLEEVNLEMFMGNNIVILK